MTGGCGSTVPAPVAFAVEVMGYIKDFREKWKGKMSKEADSLSEDSIKAIEGLKEFAEGEYKRGYAAGAKELAEKIHWAMKPREDRGTLREFSRSEYDDFVAEDRRQQGHK